MDDAELCPTCGEPMESDDEGMCSHCRDDEEAGREPGDWLDRDE